MFQDLGLSQSICWPLHGDGGEFDERLQSF